MKRVHQGKRRPLSRSCGRALAVAASLSLVLTGGLEAQLFNGGGIFQKKTDAPKDQTEDQIGVPVPVTGRVEALKGHEVQFEIRAESKTPGATVEFLIRTFPSAGRIVSMISNPNARNKAIVTYYADPESSATSDAFAFAVRYRGGRYSSEMRYDIDLVDLKIEVQAPPEVEFGEVPVGGEEVREFLVRNIGNGSLQRQIFLAPPWHLLDPLDGSLNLGPRGGRILKIAFRPELTGETSYYLSLSRSKEGTSKLIGTGTDPFLLVNEVLELKIDESSRERRGEIELRNPGEKPVLIKTRASTRLQNSIREGYLLSPGKTTLVAVNLGATDTAPFDGAVEFYLENGYSKSARVIAPVVPGKIVATVPHAFSAEVINFGKVEAGRSMERGITLTNVGGVPVPLEFHIPEPFRLLNNPGLQLAPLAAVPISVGLFPSASQRGLVDVTMNVYGSDQSVPIRLRGNIVAPEGGVAAAAPNLPPKNFRLGPSGSRPPGERPMERGDGGDASGIALSAAGPVSDQLDETGFSASGGSITERNFDSDLRRPEDLTVLRAGSDSVTIGWTAPRDSDSSSFDVEVRRIAGTAEGNRTGGAWQGLSSVIQERIDRLVKADAAPLVPGMDYEFRVIMTTPDGRSSLPSESIRAKTASPPNLVSLLLIPLGLLLAIAGVGIAMRIRRRQAGDPVPRPAEV